jgi:hypothetical protein
MNRRVITVHPQPEERGAGRHDDASATDPAPLLARGKRGPRKRGEVTLQAAERILARLAFGLSALEVGNGFGVPMRLVDREAMKRAS